MEDLNIAPRSHPKFPVVAIAALSLLLVVAYVLSVVLSSVLPRQLTQTPNTTVVSYKKFSSNEEFLNYVNKQNSSSGYFKFVDTGARSIDLLAPTAMEDTISSTGTGAEKANRVSDTNIQVQGVDEPDIVKTNGSEIYYSNSFGPYYPLFRAETAEPGVAVDKIAPVPDYNKPDTKVLKALPPEALSQIETIDAQGEMLLSGGTLVVFEGNKVHGYDVSSPNSPVSKWNFVLDNNTQLTTARMTKDKIYLITQTYSYDILCPIPLISGTSSISVNCTDIYYPGVDTNTDSVFSIISLDPASGEVVNKNSFIGLSGQTVVYVSENNAYVTVYRTENQTKFMQDFLANEGASLFPQSVRNAVTSTISLNISDQAKLVELQVIFQNYMNTLTTDARVKLQNDMANKMAEYTSKHARELEHTAIVKLKLDDLSILSSGEVPGQVLNQFSIDEWQENLRVATTISANQFGAGESVNDVYILDHNLKTIGSVMDMGRGERVYSARFMGNRGYVVTFRQTDPFYVLDLSNPHSPKVTGELKIPGFSSYLHPLSDNLILGVGRENSGVKLSLFDVSNPSSPQEISKYTLNEYWTEIQNNHHAFLADTEHSAFFIPAGQKGLVFTYKQNSIELARAVDGINAQRALYINDYLYILGTEKMVVLDEATWQNTSELAF